MLLDLFHLALGFTINWTKSRAYWLAATPPPAWLDGMRCEWAVERQLSKLLGTPFGIDLHTADVDAFMMDRIKNKLEYWP
jgi:hypothetical protein